MVVYDEPIDATCSHTGLSQGMHCANCGEVLKEQEVIEKLPHEIVEISEVEATCSSFGHTYGSYCEVCGEVICESKVIEKTHILFVLKMKLKQLARKLA